MVSLLLAAGAAVEAKDKVRESDLGTSHGPLNAFDAALHVIHALHGTNSRSMIVCMYVCICTILRSFSTIFIHEEDLSAFKTFSLCMYVCMHVLYVIKV